MILSQRNPAAVALGTQVVRLGLRRRFRAIHVAHRSRLDALDPALPVVAVANHSNWWDGFLALFLARLLPERRFHLAMEERNLARYRFFTRLGAFGLDLDRPRAGLRLGLELLRSPRNAVWIFPQGELLPVWQPFAIRGGANLLARRSGAQLLPVAFRYEWFQESRPSIVVNIGQPLPSDTSRAALERAMVKTFHEIDAPLAAIDVSSFEPLLRPRRSVNAIWDRLRGLDHDRMNR